MNFIRLVIRDKDDRSTSISLEGIPPSTVNSLVKLTRRPIAFERAKPFNLDHEVVQFELRTMKNRSMCFSFHVFIFEESTSRVDHDAKCLNRNRSHRALRMCFHFTMCYPCLGYF